MSYITGSKKFQKSMNGLIVFDSGSGVLIEGNSITTGNLLSDNIITDNLTVNQQSNFTNLPVCSIITSTLDTQLINSSIGNSKYAQLNSNNTYNSIYNQFNGVLPSSDQSTVSSNYDLINLLIGNQYYGKLNSNNVFSALNTFNNLPTSPATTSGNTNQLINRACGNIFYPQLTGNNNFLSNNTFNLSLPTSNISSSTTTTQLINRACGNLVYPQLTVNNVFSGLINEFQGTNTKISSSSAFEVLSNTSNINGINCNILPSNSCVITSPTININGTNCNILPSNSCIITSPTTNINGTNMNINSTGSLSIVPTTTFSRNPKISLYPPIDSDDVVTKNYVDQEILTIPNLTTLTTIVIGHQSNSLVDGGIAIGQNADVLINGNNAIAIGNNSICNFSNSTAIGNNSVSTAANQITLGTSGDNVRCGKMTPMYVSLIFTSGQIGFCTYTNNTSGGTLSSTTGVTLFTTPVLVVGVYSFSVQFDMGTTTNINNVISYSLKSTTANVIFNDVVFQGRATNQRFTHGFSLTQILGFQTSLNLLASINTGSCTYTFRTYITTCRVA